MTRPLSEIVSKAEAEAQALAKAQKRNAMRRFTWCRIHHELVHSPLWRLVARRASVPVHMVRLFVLEIEVFASGNKPRGSIAGLNIEAMAADWNLVDADSLARIYVELEKADVGWLDQEHIVSFHERNPDTEDPTAKERQRRRREKLRELREREPSNKQTPQPEPANLAPRYPSPEEIVRRFDRQRQTGAERTRRYRARRSELGLPADFDYEGKRELLVARDGEQCIYCLTVVDLSVDHLIPTCDGGLDDDDNLGLACRRCNGLKSGRAPEDAGLSILVTSALVAYERYCVTRDSRELTTRSDQIIKKAGDFSFSANVVAGQQGPFDKGTQGSAIHTNSGDCRDNAELWLATEGVRIVCERAVVSPPRAEYEIAGWRKKLGSDDAAVADIIAAVDTLSARGGAFFDQVRQRVSAHRHDGQRSLSLPTVVKRRG